MAPYSFMFMALGVTTDAEVNETMTAVFPGKPFTMDRVEVTEGPKAGMVKFFIHFAEVPNDTLCKEMDDFAKRKEEGEMNLQPKRIIYGVNRHGKDMYWQIFKCATPAQREAERASNDAGRAAEFQPRIG